MKNTQNQKISQIKFETLVVGIDIGKETHYARAFDYRGMELARLLKFSNTDQGFERLGQWMRDICKQQEKTGIIVGFEPTGHYWFTLGDHLKRQGHKLAIVNPFHVKRTKELDDNSPTKNDRKDPKTIAMLVKDGRYREVYIPDDIYQELREAVSERERLQEQLTSIYNRVVRWLDIRFPEFTTVFKDWRRNASLITLRSFPTPEKVMEMGVDKIVETWRKQMKRASLKRAERLVKVASRSVGRTSGKVASEVSLQNLLAEYDLYCQQYDKLEQLMQELLMQVPNADKLLDIKGVGLITAATFVGEVGDISRFQDPRQIQKLAGLNLVENSSGKHKGRTTISRRGRRRLRHSLFFSMIAILGKNQEFRLLHQRDLMRENNPLNKMQSIIALCGKLIRVFYAILTKGVDYSPEKMLGDMEQSIRVAA
ncbi:IS110 family transposase [Syntrophomonas wolfei]|uniref:Transposase n=1 Tax=Syntrophomonas wolfei subsp. wolfei (strain DSM 2245B / Goettingen) TaxID=335541 RepID=Q0AZ07_SYNWW|nr:IS110 family transposase [Syntrophomonas wolfei]ABI68047.1 transposase [Syntrophomonas wolfei subsp. wolfei str. Goettingen G311]